MAQVLIRQLEEQVVAILRELLTNAAHQHGDGRQPLAVLRRQTPASAQDLDVAALIREGREQR